jgi:nucleoside-diphosphate-sugar epimerase
MKVLITGNLGYVGPVVVRHLRAAEPEARIIGLDAGYFADRLLAPGSRPDPGVEQVFGDVRDVTETQLSGIGAIVHLAGISNDPIGNTFAGVTMRVNHEATVALAVKAKRAGVRSFVFASSCSVYGCAEDGARTEDSAVNPLTAYAKSKLAAEAGLAPLADRDFTVTSLRFATACGMSPRLRLDLVLNDFVAGAVQNREIRILSDGSPWRPLIDVRDMARAIDWAVSRSQTPGGAFIAVNAGSDEWNYQVKDLAAAVAGLIPGTSVLINKDAQPDSRSYRVSFERFRRLAPDHQPAVSLSQSIRDLRAGLEQAGAAAPGFDRDRFIRLKTLVGLVDQGLLQPDLTWSSPADSTAVA